MLSRRMIFLFEQLQLKFERVITVILFLSENDPALIMRMARLA